VIPVPPKRRAGRAVRSARRRQALSRPRVVGEPGELDDNEQAQRRCRREQDGSEIRSVELERCCGRPSISSTAPTHGGSPKGGERIAARWADHRKVPQIAFKPDWARHAKAAPFKRNDAMLEVLPIGVLLAPGTGIQENLADKARRLGIPIWKFGSGGS
jgi:hypothetical protein